MSATANQSCDTVLVLDFGTSYFKSGVVDRTGAIVALHRQPTPSTSPRPDRSEISIAAFEQSVQTACAALPLGNVKAVTWSSQANTFTLLDGDRPLMPLVVWNDARAKDLGYCPEFTELAEDAGYLNATGLPTITHELTPAKLVYIRNDTPLRASVASRIAWLPDLFMHRLTGVYVTEASIAALSGLFDVPNWRWLAPVIGGLGYGVEQLSPVVRAGTDIGTVLPAVADELRLPRGCRVIAGCLDQYAGALGVGNDAPGKVSETTGTVLATVACSGSWRASPGVFRGPGPKQGQFFHMSFGDVSAGLLEHYRQCLPEALGFDQLCADVSPEETLRLDEHLPVESLRKVLADWAVTQPRPAVVRAIFSAVARALALQVGQISSTPPGEIRCAGGAAKSRDWLQIKADTLRLPMIAPATVEPTLVGAAKLAAEALGWEAIDQPVEETRIVRPR